VRESELQCLRATIVWSALRRTLALFQAGPAIASVSAFSVFVCVQSAPLTPERAFPAIVLFTILQAPIAEFPSSVAAVVTAHASMRRIETFLCSEEFKPLPLTARPSMAMPTSPTRPHPDDPPFELRSAVFRLDSPSSKTLRTISSRDLTSSASGLASHAITRLSVAIPRGKLTLVVGAPQSGKSTLLSALVGELVPESGFVNLPRAGTVSFAPQSPFIMAGWNVRDNVLFGASLDQLRLDAVLQACELDAVVAGLPNGLLTVVSDTEDSVEGLWMPDEQAKQRMALARAVYSWSRTELFVVDDALSSVEPPDAVRVLRRCLVDADALLAGTTRVLSIDGSTNTSALELARTADWVVVMDQRKVVQAGSFEDLSTRQPSGRLAQLMEALEAKKRAEKAPSETTSEDEKQRRPSRGSRAGSESRRSASSAWDAPALPDWPEDPDRDIPWTAYSSYWSACGPLVAAGAFGVLVSAQLSAVSMDLWLANWTGDTSAPSPSPPAALMLVGLPIYAYLGVSTLVLACMGDVVARYAALR
jgi:ATP-binding cassette subfamily C (CFTR/MRP) protein 1